MKFPPLGCPCDGRGFETVFTYTKPPKGEVRFLAEAEYARTVSRCAWCRHFVSVHRMNLDGLYSGHYVDATYGDDGIERAFQRIVTLPPPQSDNAARICRIGEFARTTFRDGRAGHSVLDVGSGLCVFLHGLKQEGWQCTALDPDPRAVAHARDRVGVTAVCGDFMAIDGLGHFDLITFNKVLEHVVDPVAMLARSRNFLKPDGVVYLEVPDADIAVLDGPGREEFFIDHHHIFSLSSLDLMIARAGFATIHCERITEPSTKYTLFSFLRPRIPTAAQVRGRA